MMRILLVDDHPVVRHGIRTILTERLKGAVVGEAGDADSALSQARSTDWDVVVADISLPGTNGLDLIKELRRLYPTLPTVVVSMHPASQFARRALAAGAAGYLTKDSTPEEFIVAIEEARRGRRYVGPDGAEVGRWSAGAGVTPHDSDIARDLSLSVKTVSTYRMRVLEKLGMRTNAELMRYAIENRLLDT